MIAARGARAGAAAPATRATCARSSPRPTASSPRRSRASSASTHLIATEPETRDGRFTGRVAGTPCFREGKVRAAGASGSPAAAARSADFAESRFYSDSHNDLPLLERVTPAGRGGPRRSAARRGRGGAAGQTISLPGRIPARMIKRFIRRVFGLPSEGMLRRAARRSTASRASALSPAAAKVCAALREARLLGLRRRRRGARPAARHRAQGLRHRHRRAPRAGQAAVPPRAHHRPALPPGARHVRPRDRRGLHLPRAPTPRRSEKDEHGRVLRDNVFGTQEEDARRRDFTVNALYYDPATEEVVDFHGGLADLKKRTLRVIGDPRDALPRGPGAHAARGAPCREARPDARPATRASRSADSRRSWSACRRRACSTRC